MGKKTTDTKTTTASSKAPARKSATMAKSARRATPAAVPKSAAEPARRKTPRAGAGTRNGHRSSGSPGTEQIAVRAYYIAERRRAAGLPGNPTEDWITAERELLAEIARV